MTNLAYKILFTITFLFFFYISIKVVQRIGNYLFMKVAYSYEILISASLFILGLILSLWLAHMLLEKAVKDKT